jgi:hypothetical protein
MDTNSTVKLTSIDSTTPAPGATALRLSMHRIRKLPRKNPDAGLPQNTSCVSCTMPTTAQSLGNWVPCFAAKGFIHPT